MRNEELQIGFAPIVNFWLDLGVCFTLEASRPKSLPLARFRVCMWMPAISKSLCTFLNARSESTGGKVAAMVPGHGI
jgi:hypothetical protein